MKVTDIIIHRLSCAHLDRMLETELYFYMGSFNTIQVEELKCAIEDLIDSGRVVADRAFDTREIKLVD